MKKSHFNNSNVVLYKSKRIKHMLVNDLNSDVISDALGGGGSWQTSKALQFGDK